MCHSGPLLDPIFLGHLSKAIQSFLPGTQKHLAIETLLQHLKDTWKGFHKANEKDQVVHREGPFKKRKVEVDATLLHSDASAISFSLSAQIAMVAISSLAVQSVPQAMQDELGKRLSDLRNSFIYRKLTKTFKNIRKRDSNDVWSSQIVATASLRLSQSLEISHHSILQASDDSKLWKNVSDSLGDYGLLPELTVEIVRISEHESSHASDRWY